MDAGVVDQTPQAPTRAQGRRDGRRARGHRGGVGHIKHQRREPGGAQVGGQGVRVGGFSHGPKDVAALARQDASRRGADAFGDAGDDDRPVQAGEFRGGRGGGGVFVGGRGGVFGEDPLLFFRGGAGWW